MSLKNKFLTVLTLAIATITFSSIGFGQDKTTTTPASPDKNIDHVRGEKGQFGRHKGGREGFGRGHRGGMRMMHDLNLTDAQKEQIRSIREANKPDEATMTELRTIRESRKAGTELTQDQKDRMKAFREQSRAKAQSVRAQIEGVLTADQKALMQKHKDEMKLHMQEFRQKREQRRANPAAPATTDKPKTN